MSLSFAVSPQAAYIQNLNPMGLLKTIKDGSCAVCKQSLRAYSPAGIQEIRITGMCEPCFDWVTIPNSEIESERMDWLFQVELQKKGADERYR